MVKIQVAGINESTALTDSLKQPVLPALKNQLKQDFASACASEHFEPILCCYVNGTSSLQIALKHEDFKLGLRARYFSRRTSPI